MNFIRPRHARATALTTVILSGSILLAGCGGDDSETDFVAQASQICIDYAKDNEAIVTEIQAAFTENKKNAAADLFDQQSESMSAAVDEMAGLDRPEGNQEQIDEFLSLNRQGVEGIAAIADAVRNSDRSGLQEKLDNLQDLNAQAEVIARELGIDGCVVSEDGSPAEE